MSTVITVLLTLLQALCAAGALVLDRLSHRRVGVNHHVVFKKYAAFRGFLRPELTPYYGAAAAAAFLVGAALLVRAARRRAGGAVIRALAGWTALSALLGVELLLPAARDIPSYLYLLELTAAVWALQLVKALLAARRAR